ncbi:MAG: lytic transglycosylase domain-containing protein [Thermodesulfovibrionales bacterium]|nr:lytic transglycosylase domain-containing protein [Thermodesulfovibrionales bacterium]
MKVLKTLAILFLICGVAEAGIYKYVGEDGVVLYTDVPQGKKSAKAIKTKEKNNKAASTSSKSANITNSSSSASQNEGLHPIISKKAKENEVDPSLVTAVIKAESNGNPHAVSRKGAMGLMQLMPGTANDLQVKNPFDPEENIDGGTRYLRYLIERFNGNLTLALAAYNAGPKTVEKHGSVPPIAETKQYVRKVLALYKGKTDISFPGSNKMKKSEPIYKIIMDDGTVLFTNFPLYNKQNSVRF